MPHQPKNPFSFWQELKRRKVFRVIAMYAGAAYIIIELVNNVAEPLHLPEWVATFVILLLVIGFPIVALLSWIFDFTSEGWEKTKPAKAIKEMAQPVPGKRKLKISDAIIVVLVIVVLILAWPKIFKGGGELKAMTYTATIINEFGKEERRQVFKEEYVPKIMIMPFHVDKIDSVNSWLDYGLPSGVFDDLTQFQYILPYWNSKAIHLQGQIRAAGLNDCPNFLTGTYQVIDTEFEITTRLYRTDNGALEYEREYWGNDLFSLLDSISWQLRIDLGISENIINQFSDLPFREHMTNDSEAYRSFIHGLYYEELSANTFRSLNHAVEQDSTFALAAYYYAWFSHFWQSSKVSALKYINHAMRHRQRLPEHQDINTRILYYRISGEAEKAITLSEMQHELQPYNAELLNALIDVYRENFLINKEHDALKKLNQLKPQARDLPNQIDLTNSYLKINRINEGLKYIENILEKHPENPDYLMAKGQFHLHNNDLDKAEEAFQKAILLFPENEKKLGTYA